MAIWGPGVGPQAEAGQVWEWSGVTWDPEADLDVVAQGCTETESRAPGRRAPTLRVVSTRAWGDTDETLPVLVLVTILSFGALQAFGCFVIVLQSFPELGGLQLFSLGDKHWGLLALLLADVAAFSHVELSVLRRLGSHSRGSD